MEQLGSIAARAFAALILSANFSAAQTADSVTPAVAITPPICAIKYYPLSAIKANEEGTTIVALTVTAQGNVKNPAIQTSAGFKDLDDAAIVCANDWRFTPATKNSVPVEAHKTYMVRWALYDHKLDSVPIIAAVQKCTTLFIPDGDELATAKVHTQIDVQSESRAITRVVVTPSGGSPTLDERIAECIRQATPQIPSNIDSSDHSLTFSSR